MRSRIGLAVVGIVGVVAWLLNHAYQGIYHDANLYALQALARIHPELAGDVFLKFGSQDRFSIFSPLYAQAIRGLGVEHAAAALTWVFQAAFLVAAWTLARAFMNSASSLLGVCFLAAVPGTYGAYRVFTCMETFLTPRMAAEALALAGLAAAATSRRGLAATLIGVAALVHPIMAMAAVVCLFVLYLGLPRPRAAVTLVVVGALAYAVLAVAAGGTTWGHFDAHWLVLIDARSPYLFLRHWSLEDWAPVCVTVATLIGGYLGLDDAPSRTFSLAVLVTLLAGLALTWIGADWLHLVLPTQGQPWRWQWLGTTVSALLLPAILTALWQAGARGRSGALLLVAAWIFGSNPFALAASAGAVIALVFVGKLKPQEARHVVWGSWLLIGIASTWRIASNLQFTDVHYLDPDSALWLQRTMSFMHDGATPLALLALSGYSPTNRRRSIAAITLGAAAAALLIASAPALWAMWNVSLYSPETIARFAPMREKIPPRSEVFWPDSPASSWALLSAPSYVSVVQTSGFVFSRTTALELERRAFALSSVTAPSSFLNWDTTAEHMNLSSVQLAKACASGEFALLVTHFDLGVESLAHIPTGRTPGSLRLYRCAQPRG